jgi:Ca2+:H+ antiporter
MTTAPSYLGGISRSEGAQFIVIGAVAALALAFEVAGLSPVLVFLTAGVAVAGMAHILGIATEQAGDAAGPRLSALLNATFGNAAEIIIVVLAIREGGRLIDVARYSIIGSVLGNVLLILGASLLVAGIRHGRQRFDATVAGVNATMLLLATTALVIPTLFVMLGGTGHADEIGLSHGVAIVMAVLYVLYLYASFQSPEETGMEEGAARWSTRLSLVALAFSAIATGVLSEVLVGAIEPTIEETGISSVFIGLIVVPLIGNVAEHFAAVKIAWSGKLDFAMGIAFNSALQVALAVSAIAVAAGIVFGHEVVLDFGLLEVSILIAGALLAGLIAANGNSNWLEGAELLAIYAIAAVAFWYL